MSKIASGWTPHRRSCSIVPKSRELPSATKAFISYWQGRDSGAIFVPRSVPHSMLRTSTIPGLIRTYRNAPDLRIGD